MGHGIPVFVPRSVFAFARFQTIVLVGSCGLSCHTSARLCVVDRKGTPDDNHQRFRLPSPCVTG